MTLCVFFEVTLVRSPSRIGEQLSGSDISDASDLGTDSPEICLIGKDMLCPAPADMFQNCPGRRQHARIYLRQTASLKRNHKISEICTASVRSLLIV